MRTVFVHPERCIGCMQCEFACAVEHSKTRDPVLALFEEPVPRTRIHVTAGPRPNTSYPNRCRHCEPAPCQGVCPSGAIHRVRFDGALIGVAAAATPGASPGLPAAAAAAAATDVVLVDETRCIACAMCAIVCPFSVLTYHPLANGAEGRTVAVKCDGCIERVRAGRIPACVEACKAGALEYGDINEMTEAGRRREAATVLAATTSIEARQPVPETVGGWRALGAAAAEVGRAGGVR